jgi:hypothetical protein
VPRPDLEKKWSDVKMGGRYWRTKMASGASLTIRGVTMVTRLDYEVPRLFIEEMGPRRTRKIRGFKKEFRRLGV